MVQGTQCADLRNGDAFANGNHYPNIDVANGGNIKGVIDSDNLYLGFVDDKTHIVPGHGPLATKADLVAFRDMMVAARDRMVALIKAGKSEDEVVAALYSPTTTPNGPHDQAAISFIRLVYRSLAEVARSADAYHTYSMMPPACVSRTANNTTRFAVRPTHRAQTKSDGARPARR